jgi:hypothetical protein
MNQAPFTLPKESASLDYVIFVFLVALVLLVFYALIRSFKRKPISNRATYYNEDPNQVKPVEDPYQAYPPDLDKIRREEAIRRREARKLQAAVGILILITLIGGALLGPLLMLLFLAFGIASAGTKWNSHARKLLVPNAHLLLERDKRPLVLYLRSFQDDGSYAKNESLERLAKLHPLGAISRRRSYEERLAEVAQCVGPVVAVGRPGEPLPELGAARMYLPDWCWNEKVGELMKASRLVILRMGFSQGLKWELATATAVVPPENLVLYLEPPGTFAQHLQEVLPAVISRSFSRARFIYFDANWTPQSARTLRGVLKSKKLYKVQAKEIVMLSLVLALCVVVLLLVLHVVEETAIIRNLR